MIITDAQVHIWQANSAERPWVAGEQAHRAKPLEADELLREMDAAGVQRAVLVPPFLDGDRNDLVLAAARARPDRFAAMGRLDLEDPAAADLIPTWREQPGMLGFRYAFHRPALAELLVEERIAWLWAGAERAGVPIMVHVPHSMLGCIERVAQRHPGLKLVVDHLALPLRKKDEEAFRDLDKLLGLARYSNVATKASALPCYTNDVYPYRKLHPYIRRVLDAFGPQRTFWGSDLSRSPSTYHQSITMFTWEMPWVSAGDVEWIMGRGVSEWLDWKFLS